MYQSPFIYPYYYYIHFLSFDKLIKNNKVLKVICTLIMIYFAASCKRLINIFVVTAGFRCSKTNQCGDFDGPLEIKHQSGRVTCIASLTNHCCRKCLIIFILAACVVKKRNSRSIFVLPQMKSKCMYCS